MSTPARRRLMRDFKRLQEDPPAGVSGAPSENNIMVWNAVIFGPEGTPFEDGECGCGVEGGRRGSRRWGAVFGARALRERPTEL